MSRGKGLKWVSVTPEAIHTRTRRSRQAKSERRLKQRWTVISTPEGSHDASEDEGQKRFKSLDPFPHLL